MLVEPIQTIVIEAAITETRERAEAVDPILEIVNFLAKVDLPHSDKTNRVMIGLNKDMKDGLIELATNENITCPMVASSQYLTEDGRAIIWLPERFIENLIDWSTNPVQQLAALIYSASYTREIIHGGVTKNTHNRAQERSDNFIQVAEKHPDLIAKTIAAAELAKSLVEPEGFGPSTSSM